MNTTSTTPMTAAAGRCRRAVLAGLALAAVVTGGTLATSTPAGAAPTGREYTAPTGRVTAPPAVPGVPDVGRPGEGAQSQVVSTIDPRGRRVPPHTGESTVSMGSVSTLASGYTATVVVANGARIRSYPVTGTVIGLAYYNDLFWVSCQRRATDGYLWGYGRVGSRTGWIREDLWDVLYSTAPGAPPTRPIPYC